MRSKYYILLFILSFLILACNKDNSTDPTDVLAEKIEVVINDIPFQTEKYLRIPYTLKLWEYEKEGLKLEKIQVFDAITNLELLKLENEGIPYIYKGPLPANNYYIPDAITSYYLSIQLPIPLGSPKPTKVFHKFTLRDTINNTVKSYEGGIFSPRLSETPIIIASPVKGNNWIFINQSTNAYHFYVNFFKDGKIYNGERFAFDNLQFNEALTNYFDGDPKVNTSYHNYGDTLFAVANGKVISIKDGRLENNGDACDVVINNTDELGGNYLVLQMDNGYYAFYAHCKPNSFFVNIGANVKEGDPLALLGNSGNSTAPHLHFEITNSSDILFSNGLPFVLKKYTKIAEMDTVAVPVTPTDIYNSMMEELSIINFQ